jgi:hypothetical protein
MSINNCPVAKAAKRRKQKGLSAADDDDEFIGATGGSGGGGGGRGGGGSSGWPIPTLVYSWSSADLDKYMTRWGLSTAQHGARFM